MFNRKIYREISKWEESNKIKKRALIIKGLRQVGKTTVVLDYTKKNFENIIYMNFMENPSYKKIFDDDLNVDNLMIRISSAFPKIKLIPNKTVIIFDELQECARARTSIKSFMIDGRFTIIGTGSLLGLRGYNKKQQEGIPTGFEYIINMYPMDFEEFLLSRGVDNNIIDYLKDCYENKKKIDDVVNHNMTKYFKEYICVGGMPDAVDTFLKTFDMNQVHDVLINILEQYKDDFGKHLDENENPAVSKVLLRKILQVYNSLPIQLSKENKKFQYKFVSKNANSRDYREAITWLEEFGLIKLCYNLNSLELPLSGNKCDDTFKIYIVDSGLFIAMLDDDTINDVINNNIKVYNGAIYENIIAETFAKNGLNLYYYNKNSQTEIDFVNKINSQLTLIEVKANNGDTKSLRDILSKKDVYHIDQALKLINGNIGYKDEIYTMPHYLAYLIK